MLLAASLACCTKGTLPAGDLDAALEAYRTEHGIEARLGPYSVRRSGDWAFLSGVLLSDGAEDPSLDDSFVALARKDRDGWRIVELDAGSNDVSHLGWAAEHRLPPDLVPEQDVSDW